MPNNIDFMTAAQSPQYTGMYNQYLGAGAGGFGGSTARSLVDFLNNMFGGGFEIQNSNSGTFDQLVNEGTYIRDSKTGQWYKSTDLMQQASDAYQRAIAMPQGFTSGGTPPPQPPALPGGITNPLGDLTQEPVPEDIPMADQGGIGDFFGRMFGKEQ